MAFIRPAGDAVRFEVDLTDKDGNAVNASTILITVKDPAAVVKVNAVAMTFTGTTGSYYHVWQSATSDSAGTYAAYVEATVSGITGRERINFQLKAL